MAQPDVHVATVEALAAIFVQRVALEARRAIADRGRFSLVVPGGSVADAFLPLLLAQPISWERCDVFWGDERGVAPDAPESNAGAQRRLWEEKAPGARLHVMDGGNENLEAASRAYAALLTEVVGSPPRLDIVVLGAGEDGHVASLFPGKAALEESSKLVFVVEDSPKPPPRRMTMSLSVLSNARWLCVAAFGTSKAAAVGGSLIDRDSPLPLARLLRGARRATVLLDPLAAARLGERAAIQSAADTSTRLS